MVKGKSNRRNGITPSAGLNSIPFITKGVLFILLFTFFIPTLKAQETDTLSMGESKAQTLKYLRSLATIEKENCEKAAFIELYDVNLTSGKEVLVNKDTWIKREPAEDAKNCNTLIPENSIVKIFDSTADAGYLAVKFKNKWGFIKKDLIEYFE